MFDIRAVCYRYLGTIGCVVACAGLVLASSCSKSEPDPGPLAQSQPLATRVGGAEPSTPKDAPKDATAATDAPKPRERKRDAGGDNSVRERKANNKQQRLKKQLEEAERDAEAALKNLPPPTDGVFTNFLLITIDTLRPDRMSCYGAPRETTPRMDEIAREGTVFEHAFAQRNSTWASLATIMTSLYPVQHGVRHNGLLLKNDHLTVAEVLQQQGYVCAAVYTNAVTQNWEGFQFRYPIFEDPVDHRATMAANKWLDAHGNRKFFMWLHYFAPHADYSPPPEFNKFTDPAYRGPIDGSKRSLSDAMLKRFEPSPDDLKQLVDLYDGELLYIDHEVGKVVDKLKALGIYDKTLVMISSDHGEELYEHDAYIGHDASVYDTALRVPLIARLPNVVPAGKMDSTLVQHTTIAPTMLELAGVPIPGDFVGKSLVPLFKGEPADFGSSIAEVRDQMLMIRTAQYKYIFNPGSVKLRKLNEGRLEQAGLDAKPAAVGGGAKDDVENMPAGETTAADEPNLYMRTKDQELYDITTDPGEKVDLSAEKPDVVEQLKKDLDTFKEKFHWKYGNAVEEQVQKEVDEDTKEQLRNMGYVL